MYMMYKHQPACAYNIEPKVRENSTSLTREAINLSLNPKENYIYHMNPYYVINFHLFTLIG